MLAVELVGFVFPVVLDELGRIAEIWQINFSRSTSNSAIYGGSVTFALFSFANFCLYSTLNFETV